MTDTIRTTPEAPTRWTRLNIALHWLIVVLVTVQYFIGDWMYDFFEGGLEGKAMDSTTVALGYLHMAVGLLILLAALLRIWDRFTHGRPAPQANEPNWAVVLARVSHFALYALLVVMPIAGLTAWLLGNEWIGGQHALASKVLLGIIALHVLGALANHFWFKTDALRNMMPGRGRSSGKS